MTLQDDKTLRRILYSYFPIASIDNHVISGQRTVYFVTFNDESYDTENKTVENKWSIWGECVLKVSHVIDGVPSAARLLQEIDILKSLESRFYPKFYFDELVTHDLQNDEPLDQKILVTIEERIDGTDLSKCMKDFSCEKSVSKLAIEIIQGLSLLWNHDRNYVHRDIKPENLMVKSNGDVVILDLGIVREVGTRGVTKTGCFVGTVEYASPEQISGRKDRINYKSDLFSIGVLMYRLLSGVAPFGSPMDKLQPEDIAYNILHTEPKNLHDHHNISSVLSAIIHSLIAKKQHDRPRLIPKLLAELQIISEKT